jgi:hypothetical protein
LREVWELDGKAAHRVSPPDDRDRSDGLVSIMKRVQSCVEVLELDGTAARRVSPPDDRDRSDGLVSIMERVQSCVEGLELDGKAAHRVSPPDDRDRSDGLVSIMERVQSCVEVSELDGKAAHRVSPPDDRDRSDGLVSIVDRAQYCACDSEHGMIMSAAGAPGDGAVDPVWVYPGPLPPAVARAAGVISPDGVRSVFCPARIATAASTEETVQFAHSDPETGIDFLASAGRPPFLEHIIHRGKKQVKKKTSLGNDRTPR